MSKAKHILSSAIARRIVADAKRKGKRPPPFEGTRALVERQGWRKIIRLTAKCFLLLPLQRLLITHPSTAIVGRTLPVAVPVWFCPACGRDFRPRKEETAEGLLPVSAENMEYLKSKAREMQWSVDEVLDRVLNDCYWADKEKEQEAGTNDEAST